ncbi:hypothetical protein [Methylobacterium sp. CM6257]
MRVMIVIRGLAYQFAVRYGIFAPQHTGPFSDSGLPNGRQLPQFIFVAFAACQALLTVTQADFLSPASGTGRAPVKLAHDVGGAKLA